MEARGQAQISRHRYQDAFQLARRFKITDLALESIAAWSRLEELESGPEVALRITDEAIPEARQAGRMDIAFNLRLVRARAYFRLGQIALAESEIKLVRTEAESLGYLNQLCYALDGLVAAALQGGRLTEAVAYAKQTTALAERLGNDLVLGHALAMLCVAERRLVGEGASGELLQDSISHGKRSLEVLGRLPDSDITAVAHGYLAEAYISAGNLREARASYESAIELNKRFGLGWLSEALSDLAVKLSKASAGS